MKTIRAVSFLLQNDLCLKIYPAGQNCRTYSGQETVSKNVTLHYLDSPGSDAAERIIYKPSELNISEIRLKETVRYCCRFEYSPTAQKEQNFPELHVHNENNKLVKIEHDKDFIAFQFINYLGRSYIYAGAEDSPDNRICFEIVPDKINYEQDYINLTEAVADECAALLLDYSSPASLSFVQNQEKRNDTLLEQFIFLRKFCYSDNLEGLFASIKRNPDRELVKEDELRPLGTGMPSGKFFTSPFCNSRGWMHVSAGTYLPSEISVTHKYDSYDTPANRFIKFAFTEFLYICDGIKKKVSSPDSAYYDEAEKIETYIENILQNHFFDDVAGLEIMPVNNQVLEKREGYSQIFNAFSMINLALHLDWKGKDDVYEGEAKNTALLYEYWLFFILHGIIRSLPGCTVCRNDTGKFIPFMTDKDGLTVSLKQGTASLRQFILKDKNLSVNLYYNRTFSPVEFSTSVYWGSYSRPFRPDYTIALFPASYRNETEAIKAGDVSYIHFDAKYRLTDLTDFISNAEKKSLTSENIERVETEISGQTSGELNEEDSDSVVNTYKRGDLLKMHTYNDAIRRTIGSYVLYPGTGRTKDGSPRNSEYDEILPGVGAFAVRPSDKDSGIQAVRNFIEEIIDFKVHSATRLYRREYFDNMILRSPSDKTRGTVQTEKVQTLCMVGFIREAYYKHLIHEGCIPENEHDQTYKRGKEIYFYYHAIRDGYVYPLHKDISRAALFCASLTDFGTHDKLAYLPWSADIISTELVSAAVLDERLKENCGYDNVREQGGPYKAQYYYLVRLGNICPEVMGENLVEIDSGNNAVSRYSPRIFSLTAV
jgi:predicted component of viral defense system (DUF524 family)